MIKVLTADILPSSHRYAEYIAVPEVQYLIKVPENMSLSTAAMLPSGALWAMNTVFSAHNHVEKVLAEKGETGNCKGS